MRSTRDGSEGDLDTAHPDNVIDAVGDLICDLLHFAKQYQQDAGDFTESADDLLDRARMHFDAETGGPEPCPDRCDNEAHPHRGAAAMKRWANHGEKRCAICGDLERAHDDARCKVEYDA